MNALLLSVADAARSLSVGKTKLYQLIGAGELRTCRVGRRTLVTVASLEQLVARSCEGAE